MFKGLFPAGIQSFNEPKEGSFNSIEAFFYVSMLKRFS